jgi:hypothetical protein
MRNKKYKLFKNISLLLVLFTFSIILSMYLSSESSMMSSTPLKDSKKLYDICKTSSYRNKCYSDQFYILTKKENLSHAVDTLNHLQEKDPQNTRGCHFIAHKITQAETEKNPDDWKGVLKNLSPYLCSGGYIHGAIEVHLANNPSFRLNSESILDICRRVSDQENFVDQSCTHIMGHLILVQSEGEIPKALEDCHEIPDEHSRFECFSGTFMENLTSENLIAHGLRTNPPLWNLEYMKEIENLCRKYTGLLAKACWKEIAHLYVTVNRDDPLKIYSACKTSQNKEFIDECYLYSVGIMTNNSSFNEADLLNVCHQFAESDPIFGKCMWGMIDAMLMSSPNSTNRPISLCNRTFSTYKQKCFEEIINTIGRLGSKEILHQTCSDIPKNIKVKECLKYS